jgi:integrase
VRNRSEVSSALGHLLVLLRDRKVIAPRADGTTPVDVELGRYGQYMSEVRGLAPKTRDMAMLIVGRLLRSRFDDGPIDIAAITPAHVRRFFAQQAKLYSKPAHTGVVVASLRGYFRYRAALGDTMHALVGAVSYPANWQLASLPKALKPEEVEQLVGALGQIGRWQRRADAIVRCALDLGLRSCEIALLHLDDIDWEAGTVMLRHTKGRRDDVLPLHEAFHAGQLRLRGQLEPLRQANAFRAYLAPAAQAEWVVYAKPPFGGPRQVLNYLGRYTHRVAISNNRLLTMDGNRVTFAWKDYKHEAARRTMTLDADEFIRRFLLHVLPNGLQHIRHYGFLANRHRQTKLMLCRQLLDSPAPMTPDSDSGTKQDYRDLYLALTGKSLRDCPLCGKGHMVRIETLPIISFVHARSPPPVT